MRSSPGAGLLRGILIGVLLGAVFTAGFVVRGAIPSLAAHEAVIGENLPANSSGEQFPLLLEAKALIEEHYLRPLPNQTTLQYGAVRGFLGTLQDRLTYFIEPAVAASESNVLAGEYGGIGVQVRRDEAGKFRLYPFREGPAARAGLLDGDILLKVNDQEIAPETPQDAADQLLRGEVKADSGVKLLVGRDSGETLERFILFETIEVPSVVWRVLAEAPELGYIQILRFTSRTPEELNNALVDLRVAAVKGIALDMRNNPGGLLLESIQVASAFLPDDKIILIERNKSGEKQYAINNSDKIGQKMLDLPLVVLVNKGSASAAELVAGALKDNGRALLVGQQTFGKWSIQLIFQLSDKSSLHVTTGEFYPPSRAQLDGIGLTPDILMIPDQNGRDVELGETIRVLRKQIGS